jgi:hemerythrin-like metal-binding protein
MKVDTETISQPALVFDDAFITGVEEIDDQHRNLIHLTNEAAETFANNPTPHQVKQVVQELLGYAIYHFSTEEELMRTYGYIDHHEHDNNQHIGQHRDFASRVVALQGQLDRREYVDAKALVVFLADWIRNHILETDQHLGAFILASRKQKGDFLI